MIDPDEWKARVVAEGITLCPACESTEVMLGALGLFALVACYEAQ